VLVSCQVYDEGLLDTRSTGAGSGPIVDAAFDEVGGGEGGSGRLDAEGGAAGDDVSASDVSPDTGSQEAGTSSCSAGAAPLCADAGEDSDSCPDDPKKTEPGACGCGVVDTDTDNDGVADCLDKCPTDPAKAAPGQCGCNREDAAPGGGPAFCLKALLAHRYQFNGTGTVLTDSVGTAHGTVRGGANANLSGGALTLSGNISPGYAGEGYAALPPRLLSGLTDTTFEVWVNWRGASAAGGFGYQRIFDFGDQTLNGNTPVGNTYFFLTGSTQTPPALRTVFAYDGQSTERRATGPDPLQTGVPKHIAVVFDYPRRLLILYLDGVALASSTIGTPIGAINNANSWLGRSNYDNDPEFNGTYLEFRIYNAALTPEQVHDSFAAGTDPAELR